MLAYSACSPAAVALVRLVAAALAGGARRHHAGRRRGVRLRAAHEGVPADDFAGEHSTRACEEPYGYWNALGLTAAMGAIGCMWLGARRRGHALLSALAYPAMGAAAADAAAGLLARRAGGARGRAACCGSASCRCACAAPRCCSPAPLGAGAVARWDFSKHALSSENIALAAARRGRPRARRALLAMVVVLAARGDRDRLLHRPPRRRRALARRRAGVAAAGLLVRRGDRASRARSRTATGASRAAISHAVDSLTEPEREDRRPTRPGG